MWSTRGRRSDLRWALEAAGMKKSKPKASRGWHWGNEKKAKKIMKEFIEKTSLHGATYIFSSNMKGSRLRIMFFRLLVTVCLVMALVSSVFLAQESFGSESVYISSTDKDGNSGHEEDEFFPSYPKLTLCRKPIHKTVENDSERQLLEYAFISLGFPFASLTPEEQTLLIAYGQRNSGADVGTVAHNVSVYLDSMKQRYEDMKKEKQPFNLTKYIIENSVSCEKIFIRCQAFVFPMNCCESFHPVLTPLGLCYSFVPGAKLLAIERESRSIGFTLTFDLFGVPRLERGIEVGYRVFVTDPREPAFSNANYEQSVSNGYVTVMRTKLVKIDRTALHTAWHGLTTKCPTMPAWLEHRNASQRYSRSECLMLLIEQVIINNCNCVRSAGRGYKMANLKNMRLCDPEDMYDCFLATGNADKLSTMTSLCDESCIDYTYESEANSLQIGIKNRSRLIFMYIGDQYVLKEYKTTTISGFLSQIGGVMGLYVGASIITVVEMMIFFASWFWHKCAPHKRVTAISTSNSVYYRNATGKHMYF